MIIDVAQMLGKSGYILDFSAEKDVENVSYYPDVVSFIKPVTLKGKITNQEEILRLSAKGLTRVSMQCSRCLLPVEVDVDFNLDESFNNTGEVSVEDIISFTGDKIDITEIVINALQIAIPMKIVCSDNCKGLCPSCGKNLNEGDCDCDNTYINPKFESLKSFFKDDEEV